MFLHGPRGTTLGAVIFISGRIRQAVSVFLFLFLCLRMWHVLLTYRESCCGENQMDLYARTRYKHAPDGYVECSGHLSPGHCVMSEELCGAHVTAQAPAVHSVSAEGSHTV